MKEEQFSDEEGETLTPAQPSEPPPKEVVREFHKRPWRKRDEEPDMKSKPKMKSRIVMAQEVASPGAVNEEDEEEDIKAPEYMDIMSGPNAPVAWALDMCGWQGRTVDWLLLEEDHNLSRPEIREEI